MELLFELVTDTGNVLLKIGVVPIDVLSKALDLVLHLSLLSLPLGRVSAIIFIGVFFRNIEEILAMRDKGSPLHYWHVWNEKLHSLQHRLLLLGVISSHLGLDIVVVLCDNGNQDVHANDDDEVGRKEVKKDLGI